MHLIRVTGLDDPALEPYRTMRRPAEHRRRGIFVAEGRLVVERLLASDLRVLSLLVTERWLPRLEALVAARPAELPVFLADREWLEKLIGFHYHQGLLALAECPPEPQLEAVLASRAPPRTVVALDGLASAENVGTIVRSSAALEACAVLAGQTSCSPYLRRAVRNSLGGVFRLPILHCQDLAASLTVLRTRHGFRIVGADAHPHPLLLHEYAFPPDVCLAFGNEEYGLSAAVREQCHDLVTIPMGHGMDALNVAAASAVFLYEIRRQRG